jgi:hypothetical protein
MFKKRGCVNICEVWYGMCVCVYAFVAGLSP